MIEFEDDKIKTLMDETKKLPGKLNIKGKHFYVQTFIKIVDNILEFKIKRRVNAETIWYTLNDIRFLPESIGERYEGIKLIPITNDRFKISLKNNLGIVRDVIFDLPELFEHFEVEEYYIYEWVPVPGFWNNLLKYLTLEKRYKAVIDTIPVLELTRESNLNTLTSDIEIVFNRIEKKCEELVSRVEKENTRIQEEQELLRQINGEEIAISLDLKEI